MSFIATHTSERYPLREPMTIEELDALMKERWTSPHPVSFSLRKELFTKMIYFDQFDMAEPRLSMMGKSEIFFSQNWKSTKGKHRNYIGEKRDRLTKIHDDLQAVGITHANDYFLALCTAMREILHDKLKE